jgi:hypothetical protein
VKSPVQKWFCPRQVPNPWGVVDSLRSCGLVLTWQRMSAHRLRVAASESSLVTYACMRLDGSVGERGDTSASDMRGHW